MWVAPPRSVWVRNLAFSHNTSGLFASLCVTSKDEVPRLGGSPDKQYRPMDQVVGSSSELHTVKERMSRIESLLGQIISPEEHASLSNQSSCSVS